MLLWNKLKAGAAVLAGVLLGGLGFGLAATAFAADKAAVKAPAPVNPDRKVGGDKKPDDAKLLQGRWVTKTVNFDPPIPVPPNARQEHAVHVLTFTADDLTWVSFTPSDPKTRGTQTKPYKLDTTASPKELTSGDNDCIYELDGDTLKVAMHFLTPGRPKGFTAKDSPPGKGHIWVIELTRDTTYEPEEPGDARKLLGRWRQVEFTVGGVAAKQDDVVHWEIAADAIRLTTTNPKKEGHTFTYTAAVDRTPPELTTTNLQKEQRHHIYKLDGDTLTLAYTAGGEAKNPPPAPKGFTEKEVGAEAFKTLCVVKYERVADRAEK